MTKPNIMGKQHSIGDLKVPIGPYDEFGPIRIYGSGHQWPEIFGSMLDSLF